MEMKGVLGIKNLKQRIRVTGKTGKTGKEGEWVGKEEEHDFVEDFK